MANRRTNLPGLLSAEARRARERRKKTLSATMKVVSLKGEAAAKAIEEEVESLSIPPEAAEG